MFTVCFEALRGVRHVEKAGWASGSAGGSNKAVQSAALPEYPLLGGLLGLQL